MPKMNPEIKALWVKALRSGDYAQTDGCLRNEHGYCCLGVLSDVCRPITGGEWAADKSGSNMFTMFSECSLLPVPVMNTAGLTEAHPLVLFDGQETPLAVINDKVRLPFTAIADLIEANL